MRPAVFVRRTSGEKLEMAREFRRTPTEAELKVWVMVRRRQMLGLKFKRQKGICGYIADFYCAEHGLVLEIDGPIHDNAEAQLADDERTQVFAELGLKVVRVSNEQVNLATLTTVIHAAIGLEDLQPTEPLSSQG